jgi:hypothetical protein
MGRMWPESQIFCLVLELITILLNRKCLEAKANYYVYLLGNSDLSCAKDSTLTPQLPIFSEIDYWCQTVSAAKLSAFSVAMALFAILFFFGL